MKHASIVSTNISYDGLVSIIIRSHKLTYYLLVSAFNKLRIKSGAKNSEPLNTSCTIYIITVCNPIFYVLISFLQGVNVEFVSVFRQGYSSSLDIFLMMKIEKHMSKALELRPTPFSHLKQFLKKTIHVKKATEFEMEVCPKKNILGC